MDAGREHLMKLCDVSRETLQRLDAFAAFLIAANEDQNLISKGTIPSLWTRHILDSAQLLPLAESPKTWLDMGTGAGFPGLIVAALSGAQVTMVEARPLRVDFLRKAAEILDLPASTEIICAKVERAPRRDFDVISARAFAPLDKLLALGLPFATERTRWLLPKGRNAASELEAQKPLWQGSFQLVPSITDSEAGIIVASGVAKRGKGLERK